MFEKADVRVNKFTSGWKTHVYTPKIECIKTLYKLAYLFNITVRTNLEQWEDSTLLGILRIYLFALTADLVTFPPAPSPFSTDLMTPTATVCLISRTANRPRGAYWENGSTHIGLVGNILTMAASPDLIFGGLSSIFFPDRRSIFSIISSNRQAIWAVWQSKTGV